MRKAVLFVGAIVLAFAAGCSSGPKECNCTTTVSGMGQNFTQTFTFTAEDGDCSSGNSNVSANGFTQTTTCN